MTPETVRSAPRRGRRPGGAAEPRIPVGTIAGGDRALIPSAP